ncbi:amino acid ABC transporter permease [Paraburkholderia aspalathi]|nr:amino acid ABC transporter permease [Paraburkholderia aspalathi]
MFNLIAPIFNDLYEKTGLNFVVFRDSYEYGRFLTGASYSVQLIIWSLLISLIVGVFGAWAQSSRSRLVRGGVDAYIQIFRNTPPMVQMLFFYFALGAYTPQVDAGGYYEPMISSFGWALISLGVFGGAFNVEILRAGLEAVPPSTREAAESLSFSKWQIYSRITLPLAFRISLPSLTNNLVSLAKTTSLAYVISVPEMTYTLNQVWADNVNVPEMMLVLFLFYVLIVSVLTTVLHFVERRLALPEYVR